MKFFHAFSTFPVSKTTKLYIFSVCQTPDSGGRCVDKQPMYYYDSDANDCKPGCSHSAMNSFQLKSDCLFACKPSFLTETYMSKIPSFMFRLCEMYRKIEETTRLSYLERLFLSSPTAYLLFETTKIACFCNYGMIFVRSWFFLANWLRRKIQQSCFYLQGSLFQFSQSIMQTSEKPRVQKKFFM